MSEVVVKPGVGKNSPHRLRHKPSFQARAKKILLLHAAGKSYKEIGALFGLTAKSAQRLRTQAEKEGLLEGAEDDVLDLIADAIKVYRTELEKGNARVARDVLAGTGVLKKPREAPRSPEEGDLTLEIFMRKRLGRLTEGHALTAGTAAGDAASHGESGVASAPPAFVEATLVGDSDETRMEGEPGAPPNEETGT